MKKIITGLTLSIISSAVFAAHTSQNACVVNIDKHIANYALYMDNCDLNDGDIPDVVNYINNYQPSDGLSAVSLEGNHITSKGAIVLSQLKNLEFLDLSNNQIGPEGAEAFAKNDYPDLSRLILNDNQIGDLGAIALAKGKFRLMALEVDNNQINDKGIIALANSKGSIFSRSNAILSLGRNSVGHLGIEALKNDENLVYINLNNTQITDDDVETLAQNRSIAGFNLSNTPIHHKAISALANRQGIMTLELANDNLGDDDVELLTSQQPFLNHLNLSGNHLTQKSANILASDKNLNMLDVNNISFGDSGVKAIASNERIYALGVENTGITDAAAASLSVMPSLHVLYISHNQISDNGMTLLAGINTLTGLFASHNNIHDAGAIALSKSHLEWLDVSYNSIGEQGLFALMNGTYFTWLYSEGNTSVNNTNPINQYQILHGLLETEYCRKYNELYCFYF